MEGGSEVALSGAPAAPLHPGRIRAPAAKKGSPWTPRTDGMSSAPR